MRLQSRAIWEEAACEWSHAKKSLALDLILPQLSHRRVRVQLTNSFRSTVVSLLKFIKNYLHDLLVVADHNVTK